MGTAIKPKHGCYEDIVKSRVTLRVPEWVKRAAMERAAKEGMSLNQFVERVLAENVGSSSAAAFFAERGKGGDKDRAIALLESRPEVAK